MNINDRKLQRHGFTMSIAMKPLFCCINWYDDRYRHQINVGEGIYWRQFPRKLGHCQKCMEEIIEREEKQGKLNL